MVEWPSAATKEALSYLDHQMLQLKKEIDELLKSLYQLTQKSFLSLRKSYARDSDGSASLSMYAPWPPALLKPIGNY